VRYYLMLSTIDGDRLPRETIELSRLPEAGTAIRPPVSSRACFVTSAVPASIEATGDIRIAGTIYADVLEDAAARRPA
jgi:hypothetical protein